MYEDTFGTDWTSIDDREEAVRRAFALGVAARLGERHPGELDRINAEVDTSYDRSFVELAYHEGRNKAGDHEAVDEHQHEQVWEDLVENSQAYRPDLPGGEDDDEEAGGPPDLLERVEPDSRVDDSREAVQRPKFLTRAEAEEPDPEDRRSRRSRSGEEGSEPSEEERERFQELLDASDDEGDED